VQGGVLQAAGQLEGRRDPYRFRLAHTWELHEGLRVCLSQAAEPAVRREELAGQLDRVLPRNA
jgi:hypothetical protein